jgi:hypothetical protein
MIHDNGLQNFPNKNTCPSVRDHEQPSSPTFYLSPTRLEEESD